MTYFKEATIWAASFLCTSFLCHKRPVCQFTHLLNKSDCLWVRHVFFDQIIFAFSKLNNQPLNLRSFANWIHRSSCQLHLKIAFEGAVARCVFKSYSQVQLPCAFSNLIWGAVASWICKSHCGGDSCQLHLTKGMMRENNWLTLLPNVYQLTAR